MVDNLNDIMNHVKRNVKKMDAQVPIPVLEKILKLQFDYSEEPKTAEKMIKQVVEKYLDSMDGGN